jgi:hypothetical protein
VFIYLIILNKDIWRGKMQKRRDNKLLSIIFIEKVTRWWRVYIEGLIFKLVKLERGANLVFISRNATKKDREREKRKFINEFRDREH